MGMSIVKGFIKNLKIAILAKNIAIKFKTEYF